MRSSASWRSSWSSCCPGAVERRRAAQTSGAAVSRTASRRSAAMACLKIAAELAIRLPVLQYLIAVVFSAAGRRASGSCRSCSTRSSRRWPRTTTSGRSRCARRAAWCSIATAACWSRTATRTASRSSASTPRISNRTIRLLAAVLGVDEPRVREIVDRHRREPSYRPITIVQDATLAQVAAVTARRLDFELPDVVVEQVPTRRYPDDAGGAPVRLRRRGQRRAGRRGRQPEERRHRRAVGHREGLQRAADGRGRRQARRRQQRRPRDPDARGGRSRPRASGCS